MPPVMTRHPLVRGKPGSSAAAASAQASCWAVGATRSLEAKASAVDQHAQSHRGPSYTKMPVSNALALVVAGGLGEVRVQVLVAVIEVAVRQGEARRDGIEVGRQAGPINSLMRRAAVALG